MTKFGGVPNIQDAHAVLYLGKPSFKRKIYFYKDTGAHLRRQVDEKWLPLSTDQF